MNSSSWTWKKRISAFRYAFKGIAVAMGQPHFLIHMCVAAAVVIAGAIWNIKVWEWCAVALCIGAVLMAEAFNTAVELLADKVSPQHDPLIGKAKDVAAGAVLLIVFAAVAVGLIVFLPYVFG